MPDPDRPFEAPFDRDWRYVGDRLLHRSANFTVRSSWESVFLEGRALSTRIEVGDHYGDAVNAAIDDDEEWCVSVGCGLVAYRLGEPWQEYAYDTATDQWWEHGRLPGGRRAGGTLSLSDIRAVGDGAFTCDTDRDDPSLDFVCERYVIRPRERHIRLIERQADLERRAQVSRLHGFVGKRLTAVDASGAAVTASFGDDGEYSLRFTGSFEMQRNRRAPTLRVQPGNDDVAPVLAAFNDVRGRPIHQLDSPLWGSLTLQIERRNDQPTTTGVERDFLSLFATNEPVGAWTARSPDGEVTAPGPDGWPSPLTSVSGSAGSA